MLIPSEKLKRFFSQFKTFHYKKGDVFLRSGDIPQGVYYIRTGYVRLYTLSLNGKELTLVIYKPGEFFPVVFTFTADPSVYNFETLSETTLFRAPRDKFINFINENEDVLKELTLHIIERFQVALRRMEYLTFGNAKSRLASVMVIYTKRLGERRGKSTLIPIPLTHKDISNLVGVARETVSLEIKKFADRGIINYKGKYIEIKNIKELEREANLI